MIFVIYIIPSTTRKHTAFQTLNGNRPVIFCVLVVRRITSLLGPLGASDYDKGLSHEILHDAVRTALVRRNVGPTPGRNRVDDWWCQLLGRSTE